MKYLEQRVKELELEVKLLKAKNKLEETKKLDYLFSHSDQEFIDQEFIKKFGLETSNGHFWDSSEMIKNPLDTITVNLSSIANDVYTELNYTDCSDLPEYYPPYPDNIDSWDNKNFNDVINENVTDDCGFKMNYEEPNTTWGFESEFDKQDKNFLNYLNSTEKKIEREFGKIISRFKILTHEWEMDGYGYIVSDNYIENNKKIILTNHNKPFVADKDYLNDIISGYKERIQETQRALFLIK
jgi:hypothetical protein